MSALQQSINKPEELDIKSTISSNRLLGLWRLMRGFRLQYVGANVALGISATSKTLTYLLLRYFIDDILAPGKYNLIPLAALGFVLLAFSKARPPSSPERLPPALLKASPAGCAITSLTIFSGCPSNTIPRPRPVN